MLGEFEGLGSNVKGISSVLVVVVLKFNAL